MTPNTALGLIRHEGYLNLYTSYGIVDNLRNRGLAYIFIFNVTPEPYQVIVLEMVTGKIYPLPRDPLADNSNVGWTGMVDGILATDTQ